MLGSSETDGECIYLIAQGQVDVLRAATHASCTGSEHPDADAEDEPADLTPCDSSFLSHYLLLLRTVLHADQFM